MATVARKNSDIRMRIDSEHKILLKYAARCTGQDLTSYIISTVLERARKDIKEHQETEKLYLHKDDFSKVLKALKNPSEPSEKLINALKQYREEFPSEEGEQDE